MHPSKMISINQHFSNHSLLSLISQSVKAFELRKKTDAELLEELSNLKTELASLRVQKIANGAPSKIAQIGSTRKAIARVLTVLSQKQREALRLKYAGAKYLPTDLRAKKTRAIRRRLSKEEANKKTVRQLKKASAFPMKKFAIKA